MNLHGVRLGEDFATHGTVERFLLRGKNDKLRPKLLVTIFPTLV